MLKDYSSGTDVTGEDELDDENASADEEDYNVDDDQDDDDSDDNDHDHDRKRKRNSPTKRHARDAAAAAAGKRRLSHGARSKNQPRLPKCAVDKSCCRKKLDVIVEGLARARRTKKEVEYVSKKPETVPKVITFHLGRLRTELGRLAFDINGNCEVHQDCLASELGVTHNMITTVKKDVMAQRMCSVRKVSKQFVIAADLLDDVLVPAEQGHLTQRHYLATLALTDQVMVPAHCGSGYHGLTGKEGNRALKEQHAAFVKFVENERVPTGRTKDEHGRTHGASYYLPTQLTALRLRKDMVRPVPEAQVLECAFRHHCKTLSPALRPTGGSTVARWMAQDFGPGAANGQTVLHPHKTDECELCGQIKGDIQ